MPWSCSTILQDYCSLVQQDASLCTGILGERCREEAWCSDALGVLELPDQFSGFIKFSLEYFSIFSQNFHLEFNTSCAQCHEPVLIIWVKTTWIDLEVNTSTSGLQRREERCSRNSRRVISKSLHITVQVRKGELISALLTLTEPRRGRPEWTVMWFCMTPKIRPFLFH